MKELEKLEELETQVIKLQADLIALKHKLSRQQRQLPETYEDLGKVDGWWIDGDSTINTVTGQFSHCISRNIFYTESQAKSARAKAMLSQLMIKYNNGWVADWSDGDLKYVVRRFNNKLEVATHIDYYCFLAFKDIKIAELFLSRFKKEIREYYEMD